MSRIGTLLYWACVVGVLCYALNILIYIRRCRQRAVQYDLLSLQPSPRHDYHRRMAAAYYIRADYWWLSLPEPESLP